MTDAAPLLLPSSPGFCRHTGCDFHRGRGRRRRAPALLTLLSLLGVCAATLFPSQPPPPITPVVATAKAVLRSSPSAAVAVPALSLSSSRRIAASSSNGSTLSDAPSEAFQDADVAPDAAPEGRLLTDWPVCPERGCISCPGNATGRPDCRCLEGFTVSGNASNTTRELRWHPLRGWLDKCIPVLCGRAPSIPQAQPIEETILLTDLRFSDTAKYRCGVGYAVGDFGDAAPMAKELANSSSQGSEPGGGRLLASAFEQDARYIEARCSASGIFNTSISLCLPTCGDGRLVSTRHLPMYDPREQCDDGNSVDDDGCTNNCRVMPGFACAGGSPTTPDRCFKAGLFATSSFVLGLTGARQTSKAEIEKASKLGLALAVSCPTRDVEVLNVLILAVQGARVSGQPSSSFHSIKVSAEVSFRVKISDPEVLTIDEIRGSLRTSSVFLPRLHVALADRTSLSDLYISVVDLADPQVVGDIELGRPERFSVMGLLIYWATRICPVLGYFFLLTTVVPWAYYYFVVRHRYYSLMGRFDDLAPEFKHAWHFNICTCLNSKLFFLSLIILLPVRLADTWHKMGLLPYWTGIRHSLCCCFLYLGGCGCCGACIAAQMRSEMKDFFAMGDDKKGNIEYADWCYYVCCPLCCVVQEAKHVDKAFRVMPPPLIKGDDDEVEDDDESDLAEEFANEAAAVQQQVMDR